MRKLYVLVDYSGEDESDTSNKQRIGDQSRVLMNHFIRGRIERDGLGDQLSEEELYEVGTPRGMDVFTMVKLL